MTNKVTTRILSKQEVGTIQSALVNYAQYLSECLRIGVRPETVEARVKKYMDLAQALEKSHQVVLVYIDGGEQ